MRCADLKSHFLAGHFTFDFCIMEVLRCCLIGLGLPWTPEQISGRLELLRRNEFFSGPRGDSTVDAMIFRGAGN